MKKKPSKAELAKRLKVVKSALKARSFAGAIEIGKAIGKYREEGSELPELLTEGLKAAYHSKYFNLSQNLTSADLSLATEMNVSLRAALRLLPLFGIAREESVSKPLAKTIEGEAKSLLASFSNKRGETKAWEDRVDSAIKKYSKSIKSGSRGQFLHQRHRAIKRALTDAHQEVLNLLALAPANTKATAQIAALTKSIQSAQTLHDQLQIQLRQELKKSKRQQEK